MLKLLSNYTYLVTIPVYFYPDLEVPYCFSWPHVLYNPQSIPTILHINRETTEPGLESTNAGSKCRKALSNGVGGGRLPAEYKQCQHEIEARDQWGVWGTIISGTEERMSCPRKPRNIGGQVKSANIWSGMCDMRFESIRWLGISYNMFSTWVEGISTNTIWTGMEVVL